MPSLIWLLVGLLCLPVFAQDDEAARQQLQDACHSPEVRAQPELLTRYSLRHWKLRELLCLPYAEFPLTDALSLEKDPRRLAELETALARHFVLVCDPGEAARLLRKARGRLQPGDPLLDGVLAVETELWRLAGDLPEQPRPAHGPLQARTELGRQLWAQGKKDEALEEFRAALAGWEEVRARFQLTAFDYPYYEEAMRPLAELAGDERAAVSVAELAYRRLRRLFSYSSEAARLELVSRLNLVQLLAPHASTPAGFQALTTAVLRSKGLAVDTLLEDVGSGLTEEGPRLVARAREARRRLGEPGGDRAQRQRELDLAQQELSRFNTSRRPWGHRALNVMPDQFAYWLKGRTLAEFIRFGDHYGVLVLTQTDTRWYDLGPAAALEAQVYAYRRAVRGSEALEPVLRQAYQAWVAPWIGGVRTQTLVISPDGELNFVSWASLVAPSGHFLGEDQEVRLVATGRDLLAPGSSRVGQRGLFVGDPDFQRVLPAGDGTRGASEAELRYLGFTPLPGARQEAVELRESLPSGWTGEVLLGAQATERELRGRFPGPQVLHLATHGFFLPELARGADPSQRLGRPMQRSGMALAGAGRTVKGWKDGRIPPESEDGILTAEEVSALNLRGVWLVVMSACDTGLGEARAGEGVLGLRRGFLIAGASQLLFTLWPVNDQVTRDLMKDFYRRALADREPAWRSLALTQRDWLVKLRQQRGTSAAARLAGAFVLTSTGPR